MKRLILLIAMIATVAVCKAQTGSAVKLPLAVGDTIKNAGTVAKVIKLTGGYSGLVVQVNLSVLSGTGAGTVQMYASLDGVNYTAVGSAYTITSSATQSAQFYITAPNASYYKILATGSGTESTVLSAWYRSPKYQTL